MGRRYSLLVDELVSCSLVLEVVVAAGASVQMWKGHYAAPSASRCSPASRADQAVLSHSEGLIAGCAAVMLHIAA